MTRPSKQSMMGERNLTQLAHYLAQATTCVRRARQPYQSGHHQTY